VPPNLAARQFLGLVPLLGRNVLLCRRFQPSPLLTVSADLAVLYSTPTVAVDAAYLCGDRKEEWVAYYRCISRWRTPCFHCYYDHTKFILPMTSWLPNYYTVLADGNTRMDLLQHLSASDDGSPDLLSTSHFRATDTDDAADESDDDDEMPELMSSSDDEDIMIPFLASATACSAA